ncbi:hypothetical protein HYT17_01200 [Candidatus Microgenomates bacterium]|nr:hypothetical protein [Candidatus Microgenomates bacterium]
MGRNIKEGTLSRLSLAVVLAAAVVGINACRQEQAPQITQVVVPPFEEQAQKPPEQVKKLPELFQIPALLEWRSKLDDNHKVFIYNYGHYWRIGWVTSDIGVRTRLTPEFDSEPADPSTWLQQGQDVAWQIVLEKRRSDGELERWAVIFPAITKPDGTVIELEQPVFVPLQTGFVTDGVSYNRPDYDNAQLAPQQQPTDTFEWKRPRG